MTLELAIPGGTTLDDAIAEACKVAKATGHAVRFEHNQRVLTARPRGRRRDEARRLRRQWERWRREDIR